MSDGTRANFDPLSHDELRARVSSYAAGVLSLPEADALREHLVACGDCLGLLLQRSPEASPSRPRELPEASDVSAEGSVVSAPSSARGGRIGVRGVGTLALVLATVLVWTLYAGLRRDHRYHDRLTALEIEQAHLRALIDSRDAELSTAHARSTRQAAELEATGEAQADLQRLFTVARALLPGDAAEQKALVDLLRTTDTQVVRLDPTRPFRDLRAQVLWHPARSLILLSAFGLPRVGEDEAPYRAILEFGKARSVPGPNFIPDSHGDIVLPIALTDEPAALRTITVVWGDDPPTVIASGHPETD